MAEVRFPVHADSRGTLVPVEAADAGFDVRRVFAVSGTDSGGARGGHQPGCRELIVLVTGSVVIEVRDDAWGRVHRLTEPGAGVHVGPDERVDYELGGPGSVIMVLCDAPYGRPR